MNNIYGMTGEFETKKNVRAGTYTLLICVVLLLLFFFIKWSTPSFPAPVFDEGIEVNLGSSDAGLGTDQPFEPGKPAAREQQEYTPPRHAAVENTPVKEVETDDRDEEAPVIKKPPVVKPEATRLPEKDIAEKKPAKATLPVTNPTPAPPKPKAVFRGVAGTGTGGNDADGYKKGGSEGISGGRGDQGQPGGDPNSKNYEGSRGTGSGVSITRGLQGRRISRIPSFEDDFNENAKVAVDIKLDENGNVTSAVYQPRGSTTAAASLKSIAIRKALQIKFTGGSEESFGTIVFNFRLRN
jgi:hypothetical protein